MIRSGAGQGQAIFHRGCDEKGRRVELTLTSALPPFGLRFEKFSVTSDLTENRCLQ